MHGSFSDNRDKKKKGVRESSCRILVKFHLFLTLLHRTSLTIIPGCRGSELTDAE